MPKALTDDEKMLGFEAFCGIDLDPQIKNQLAIAYGNIKDIESKTKNLYPQAKNRIIALIQRSCKSCFDAGRLVQKNKDWKDLSEANEELFKYKNGNVARGVTMTNELYKMCLKNGLSRCAIAKALNVSPAKLDVWLKTNG